MHPGEGACRIAKTRANATFANTRGAKASKREVGFDRIEIIAEMHAQGLHTGFDSEPLHTGLYNPRWPHTSEEYKLEMDVEVERLKLEYIFSEPPPSPQDDLSPRQSHAAGTGLDEPGVRHAETQPDQEGTFLFKPMSMAFCTLFAQGFRNRREI